MTVSRVCVHVAPEDDYLITETSCVCVSQINVLCFHYLVYISLFYFLGTNTKSKNNFYFNVKPISINQHLNFVHKMLPQIIVIRGGGGNSLVHKYLTKCKKEMFNKNL